MRNRYCFIALCVPATEKQRIKGDLALRRGILRVTDHGGHIKINATIKALPNIKGLHWLRVRDRTTHFDPRYWDFATDAFRHALKRGHTREQAMGVMFHYLANLFGIPEPEWCEREAAGRRYLNASVTEQQAHGWELPHVEKIKARLAKGSAR